MIYGMIAIALMAVFYGAYFAKIIYLRRRNIKVNHLGRGKKDRVLLAKEIWLKFITFSIIAVQLFSLYYHGAGWPIAGLSIAGLGVAVFIASLLSMKNSWRVGISAQEKTKLITAGVYRFSRNPAFVGFDLMYIGLWLAFPSGWHLIIAALAIISLHFQILEEERHLSNSMREEYQKYKNRTRRYI